MLVALGDHDGLEIARDKLQAHTLQLLRMVLLCQGQRRRHSLHLYIADRNCDLSSYRQLDQSDILNQQNHCKIFRMVSFRCSSNQGSLLRLQQDTCVMHWLAGAHLSHSMHISTGH